MVVPGALPVEPDVDPEEPEPLGALELEPEPLVDDEPDPEPELVVEPLDPDEDPDPDDPPEGCELPEGLSSFVIGFWPL